MVKDLIKGLEVVAVVLTVAYQLYTEITKTARG